MRADTGRDRRRYKAPAAAEVTAIMPGDGSDGEHVRDIIVRVQGGGCRRISDMNPAYMPLHFPLLFPQGQLGWQCNIAHGSPDEDAGGSCCLCHGLQSSLHPPICHHRYHKISVACISIFPHARSFISYIISYLLCHCMCRTRYQQLLLLTF